MFFKRNKYKEAKYAAGLNFDLDDVEPFLQYLSTAVLDFGFRSSDIRKIQDEIHSMNIDHEEKEIGTFDVIYKDKATKIRIVAEIHIEDQEKEVVLYMYSDKKLVNIIDQEMMKIGEELD